MTEKLYLADAALQTFDATVQSVDDNLVELDRTAFYVTGGGQPHDTGLLSWAGGEASVDDVRTTDGRVWHQLTGDIPTLGSEVTGVIDQDRRHKMMRTHT
ncbi:MAG: alanyl-tRNA editing protein, partial [Actinomycetota bacterium]|nr:alanyl-tRNA editing protein [Actinomycetota bacterium]